MWGGLRRPLAGTLGWREERGVRPFAGVRVLALEEVDLPQAVHEEPSRRTDPPLPDPLAMTGEAPGRPQHGAAGRVVEVGERASAGCRVARDDRCQAEG